MHTMLEHLNKLAGRIKKVEEVAEAMHRIREQHESEATTEKKSAGFLARNGIPALVIGSVALVGLRRRRARNQGGRA